MPVLELAQEGGKPLGAGARPPVAGHSRPDAGCCGGLCRCHSDRRPLWRGCRASRGFAQFQSCASAGHFRPAYGVADGGFVFAALRFVLALWPAFALRVPTRKLAALGGLAAGGLYLALSGGNVATQRAYIMVAVMFVAVLLDRRAISLRQRGHGCCDRAGPAARGAGAGRVPDELWPPTVALVAIFRALNDDGTWRGRVPRWAMPVVSVVLCSVVAGVATAPIAAASFQPPGRVWAAGQPGRSAADGAGHHARRRACGGAGPFRSGRVGAGRDDPRRLIGSFWSRALLRGWTAP